MKESLYSEDGTNVQNCHQPAGQASHSKECTRASFTTANHGFGIQPFLFCIGLETQATMLRITRTHHMCQCVLTTERRYSTLHTHPCSPQRGEYTICTAQRASKPPQLEVTLQMFSADLVTHPLRIPLLKDVLVYLDRGIEILLHCTLHTPVLACSLGYFDNPALFRNPLLEGRGRGRGGGEGVLTASTLLWREILGTLTATLLSEIRS